MIENTLFNIPMWSIPTLNFKKKKPQLEKLCKAFPEKKHGIQTFSTNRQRDRSGFAEAFNNIVGEELGMLSEQLKKIYNYKIHGLCLIRKVTIILHTIMDH